MKKTLSEESELQGCSMYAIRCGKSAEEHRQLAGWLKELKAYKEQEPCENTDQKNRIARERYEDLVGYFGGDETILESREEFQKWLGRIIWHFKKCCELAREKEPEPCEDAISREAALLALTGVNLLGKKPEELISLFDKRIKALPSVTAKQKTGEWIELKDQKPEAYEDVLVKDIDGDVTCAHMLDESISGISFYEAFGGECIEDVVEWREIPV